ncbi:hypothetical protein FACS1894124_5250 [Spirochaetia bacterium]|jgi:hypothetical protein|nr:hypothetical protein FACS1894124_5250 [Spirochaetia bacterium]
MLSFILVLSTAAHADPTALQKSTCVSVTEMTEVKTGKKLPHTESDSTNGSDDFRWTDGNVDFQVSAGSLKSSQGTKYFVNLSKTLNSAGATPDQKLAANDLRAFSYSSAKGLQFATLRTKVLYVEKAPGDVVIKYLSSTETPPSDAERVLTTNADGSRHAVTTQIAPGPVFFGYQETADVETCDFQPESFAAYAPTGLFARLKARLALFDKAETDAVAAEKALAECQASPNEDRCVALQKAAAVAQLARDNAWASIVRNADIAVPQPPRTTPQPGHSGGSGGGGSSGGGSTPAQPPRDTSPKLCPDGQWHGGGECKLCPDGKWHGGDSCHLGPDGNWHGGEVKLCPDGKWHGGGGCTLCPDGEWHGGTSCHLAPDGKWHGDGD